MDLAFTNVLTTATDGTDFAASTNQVTILAGATSAQILLTGLDDCDDDDEEKIHVDIVNVVNGLEDTPGAVTTLTIST